MPTYQYQCQGCAHDFELYQSFSEDPIEICPECGEKKIQKVISGGAGVVFKGGGFYETDYKRGKGSEYQKKSDADGGKKSSKGDASKGDGSSKAKASSSVDGASKKSSSTSSSSTK
jgi:putative FmdB family regulatory protein